MTPDNLAVAMIELAERWEREAPDQCPWASNGQAIYSEHAAQVRALLGQAEQVTREQQS